MSAARITEVADTNNCSPPTHESQVRPLTALPKDRQAEAWEEEARKEKEAATAAAQGRKPRDKRFKPVWELVKINRNRQAVAAEVG